MKTIKIASFLLLILSISISCEKDEDVDPLFKLAQNLQDGFWEDTVKNYVIKFDGTNVTSYGLCIADYCAINFPCIYNSIMNAYTLGDNTITLAGIPIPIKIDGDILTVDGDILHRRETLDYSDCE